MADHEKEPRLVCRRLSDGTIVMLRADQETEVMRVKLPPDVTREELEAFVEHLLKLARETQHGSN
jgi:4-aminobutyrate aminotransferase-like enzyme